MRDPLGRPPSPAGRIADIDATIALWERTVRWHMMQIAARWER